MERKFNRAGATVVAAWLVALALCSSCGVTHAQQATSTTPAPPFSTPDPTSTSTSGGASAAAICGYQGSYANACTRCVQGLWNLTCDCIDPFPTQYARSVLDFRKCSANALNNIVLAV